MGYLAQLFLQEQWLLWEISALALHQESQKATVYFFTHYIAKVYQKAFVSALFIHFQRVKQPIYRAVSNLYPKSWQSLA